MKMFRKNLRDQAIKIINYEKKEMIPLTDEETRFYEKQTVCYICEKEFSTDRNDKKYHKYRDHFYYTEKFRGAAHNDCNLRYKIPKKIPIVFHNGSTYDYHFIIKQLVIEFKGAFKCSGEYTKKYITFAVPIKKNHNKGKRIIYRLKFIDSFRFMSTSLSSLVNNLSEIYKKNLNHERKKKVMSECILIRLKNKRLYYKCKEYSDESYKSINGLNKKFPNTYRFCNGDVNKFVLLFKKRVYPYEYMNNWEKCHETSIPDKEDFNSELNKEGISNADYANAQKVWKVFQIKNLGDYHDLYVQSNTLLLADVFENFRDKCIELYELDPSHFLSSPGLA